MNRQMFQTSIAVVMTMALSLMIHVPAALADKTDELGKLPIAAQCQQKADIVKGGIVARNSGFERKISNTEEHMVHEWIEQGRVDDFGNPIAPRESMWVIGWNKLSDRDQMLFSELAFLGWDVADRKINEEMARARADDPDWSGKINIHLMPSWVHATLNSFMEQCLMVDIKPRRLSVHFIRAASSDKIEPLESMVLRHSGCRHNISPAFQNCMARTPDADACMIEVRTKYVVCMAVRCESVVTP